MEEYLQTQSFNESRVEFLNQHLTKVTVNKDSFLLEFDLIGGAILTGKDFYLFVDNPRHMVKGLRGGSSPAYSMPNLYFFNSKGVYDKKKTAMYRNAAKINSNATQIKKLLGKYKKVSVIGESCFGNGKGSDVVYVYDNIELSVFRPTGKDASAEIVESVSQRY